MEMLWKKTSKLKNRLICQRFIGLSACLLLISCSPNSNKTIKDAVVKDTASEVEDTTSLPGNRQTKSQNELEKLQREEAKDEAREEYYSTDGDQADNPDFDDDFPGDEHDEEFLGNEGDPELYNE